MPACTRSAPDRCTARDISRFAPEPDTGMEDGSMRRGEGLGAGTTDDREQGVDAVSARGPTGARQRTLRSTNVFAFVG